MMELLGQLISEKFKEKKKRGFFFWFVFLVPPWQFSCHFVIVSKFRNDEKQVLKN